MKKIVTLGEVLLRLSSHEGVRLNQADQLTVQYGGAEANVAVSLASFGYEAYVVSKVPDNPLGEAARRHLRAHGVHTDYLLTGGERMGTYYVEAGVGERSAQVIYDRRHSSFSGLGAGEVAVDEILEGAALIHVTGITLALSPSLRTLVKLVFQKARSLGVKVSFDFNYRARLWSQEEAGEAFRDLLPYVDICFCGEMDAVHLLGLPAAESKLPVEERTKCYYDRIAELYPNIAYLSSTFRTVKSASSHSLQGNLFAGGELYLSRLHQIEPIIDRIGGGDAFAAGILWGILEELPGEQIISFATAASALKHTVHGDCNPFSAEEVFQFAATETGAIKR